MTKRIRAGWSGYFNSSICLVRVGWSGYFNSSICLVRVGWSGYFNSSICLVRVGWSGYFNSSICLVLEAALEDGVGCTFIFQKLILCEFLLESLHISKILKVSLSRINYPFCNSRTL